jgi:hypothetical protein
MRKYRNAKVGGGGEKERKSQRLRLTKLALMFFAFTSIVGLWVPRPPGSGTLVCMYVIRIYV